MARPSLPLETHRIHDIWFSNKNNSIVRIFESHGDPIKIRQALAMIKSHAIMPYPVTVDGVSVPGSGGTVVSIHKKFVSSNASATFSEGFVGRLSLGGL